MYKHFIQVHIADIHFGCVDPETELNILTEQFLNPISRITFNVLAIDGDLFDRRFAANNAAISCAIEFVNRCAMLCRMRDAALIIISGTESHDAGQLSLFYDLASTTGCNIHIVEHIQFVYVKGVKILCIPEEYRKGSAYYENFLKDTYDFCFLHGTLVGGVPGATQEVLDSSREPIFSIDSFSGCKGPVIAGHVHTAMCLNSHMYYLSSPMRYRFGEEAEKGYGIVITDMDTYRYTYQFMPIQSFYYNTIDIGALNTTDPNLIIQELERMTSDGITHVRLNCNGLKDYQIEILSKYIRENNKGSIKLQNASIKRSSDGSFISDTPDAEEVEKLDKLKFILDANIDSLTKFVMYLNYNEGSTYITVEDLKKILYDN